MEKATKEELKALRMAKRFTKRYLLTAIDMNSCKYIHAINMHSNITQKRLGELLGQKSRSYICNIIAGRRVMGVKERMLLADLLKLNKTEKLALLEGK